VSITSTAAIAQAAEDTNLVCLCCGHIQAVQRDRRPSRCAGCREPFSAHGYLLDDGEDASALSEEVLTSKCISIQSGRASRS